MNAQAELRDELLTVVLRYAGANRVTTIEAAIACMGACAVVIGAMHPNARAQVAESVTENLLDHANQRAKQIRSGELDNHFQN